MSPDLTDEQTNWCVPVVNPTVVTRTHKLGVTRKHKLVFPVTRKRKIGLLVTEPNLCVLVSEISLVFSGDGT